ncbi:High-affnity carbon uptake protein Hat/HatR, partial [Bathymodiolus heckerae thiotrophic gill symbiont]
SISFSWVVKGAVYLHCLGSYHLILQHYVIPIFLYELTGRCTSFISLRNIPPKIPFETMRKITTYFNTAESDYKLDPSYEDTEKTAIKSNVTIFKDLQKFQSVGLVVPVDAQFMYFAAINSKSCRLTALG